MRYKDLLLFTEYSEQSPAELGLPGIPWDQLLDNAANETIGHSFIDTLFQRDGGASKGWVIKKVLQDSSLRSKWIKSIGDNGVEINLRMAYRYGLRIEKALELLAVLAHISGGFPLRAWELLVVRHRNTSNGGIRNILCDQGLIMIVTGAHKGFTTTGRLKIIHRFLPREVGTLLTYYLWLVLPFWEDIQANVCDKSIFNAGLWATEGTQESERQQDGDQADAAIEASQAQASQDGEGGQDGWKLGPGEHWTSPRLSRSIRRLSVLACGQKLNISSWRHISTAIGRQYFRNASTAHTRLLHEVDSDDSGSESDSDEDSPYDLQAGHGSKTAGLIYGRLVTEGAFETNERRVNFRYISEEWHRLLGFPSAMGGFGEVLTPGRKRKNASICDEALRKLQLERWKMSLAVKDQKLIGLRASARKHSIKLSTLRDRCAGAQDITTARQKDLSVTVVQEEDLVNYIIEREQAFQPLTKQEIHDFAQALSAVNGDISYLGKSWVDRFISRHQTIEMKPSRVIDAARKRCVTEETLGEYYHGLNWVIESKNILRQYSYNVDETGV
ncbi:hypothetical protein FOQG_17854 [Fusarium oxysporum f. sp. raphani 54005]|uniref:HTH CENPB-type domain-containing protein n=1 Tax=Fusarium oxysporum f. sp. raphani 54005 TaxID=1089458 RepID=X0BG17_FUSOX|nr:hypothetical protein FOQG_17854 [Fusarium oxysporum f. sp. raphani 54005]